MLEERHALRTQILRDYEDLEPGESDTWNPVALDFELTYRLSLLFALTRALRLSELALSELRVLDVGTGNGRSTRIYLDLGLYPEQLTGVELRPGAVAVARQLHQGIDHRLYDGSRIGFPDGSFNWVQLATVFSSIEDHAHRRHLAKETIRQLSPGGYLFYFDLWRANGFAGGDVLGPETLYADLDVVWSSPIRAHECLPSIRDAVVHGDRSLTDRIRKTLRPRTRLQRFRSPSHYVLLARKPLR